MTITPLFLWERTHRRVADERWPSVIVDGGAYGSSSVSQ